MGELFVMRVFNVVFILLLSLNLNAVETGDKGDLGMKGQRIFYTGHSFHVFIPPIMDEIAASAGIKGQKGLGLSSIGGSRVIQHWEVPAGDNKAKETLLAGNVDVLTLAPIFMPDKGIKLFSTLALKNNPNIRITVQEDWMWRDVVEPITALSTPKKFDYDAATGEELLKIHAPVFKSIDDCIAGLNKELDKQVLFIVPAGQAVIALRELIRTGKAEGLKTQTELFVDRVGHPGDVVKLLVAYCHYAVIYRRSPVGLPAPKSFKGPVPVRLLQEISWEAVVKHPLSGVK